MSRWSLQAVEKIAPDAASLAAGRKLATPGPWSETGSTEALVWGKCQGSGKTPYQVSIDLNGPAYRCSCPSRKFPCKHAIALLLLWVRGDGSVADVAEGADFAREWAQTRAERAAASAARPAKEVDPAARAKRVEDRLARMDAGLEDFGLWLTDLVRAGTVAAKRHPYAWWDGVAARLVDAQLPGLAEQVRDLASEIHRRDDWADHLLGRLGLWWTATRAWQRRAELDERTLADLRVCLGWATATEDVRTADAVPGRWQVLGAHRSDDGRLQQQRTWLREVESGEIVVVLDFAAGANPLPAARLVGSVLDTTVARYPGSWPRRALFATEPALAGTDATLPAGTSLRAALDVRAATWAENPWAARVPVLLADAVLSSTHLHDATGAAVPLLPAESPWTLIALTGSRPTTVFGELEETGFRPLAVGPAS
ncbi:MAG: SWIM zinc finger family protein [Nocardioidaceae bacterium]|nr:SWIM zinc finger family protein [Nocardioidaceae bacterium]